MPEVRHGSLALYVVVPLLDAYAYHLRGVRMNAVRFEFPNRGMVAMTARGEAFIPPMPVTPEMIAWKERCEAKINKAVNATEIAQAQAEMVLFGASMVRVGS